MKTLSTIFCLLLTSLLFGQEQFKNKAFNFTMDKPTDWIEGKTNQILKNLNKYEIDDALDKEFKKTRDNTIPLAIFYKYDPKKYAGLIPTIQVNIRPYLFEDFGSFFKTLTEQAYSFEELFEGFSFEVEPTEVEISGIKSFYFVMKFDMQPQKGQKIKVRSRTYAIPYGKYFFQINFTDSQDPKEDNSTLFDKLIKTVKIGN